MLAARARHAGRELGSLIAKLRYPAEGREYRLKILGVEDFKSYGQDVLKHFEQRAKDAGIQIASPSYEGVRLIFPQGWALLRMSLHDPNMPLNVESREAGGCAELAARVRELLAGFEALDMSVFEK